MILNPQPVHTNQPILEPKPLDLGLSAKEIVDTILKGKKVTIEFNSYREFQLLYSNLNVEKSRKRAAHVDFGLDFENKIIKTVPAIIPAKEENGVLDFEQPTKITFFCTDPVPPKKYAVFAIED